MRELPLSRPSVRINTEEEFLTKNNAIRIILHILFSVFYFFARSLHKPLKILCKPIVRVHPRLHFFGITIRGAIIELIKPPIINFEPRTEATAEVNTETTAEIYTEITTETPTSTNEEVHNGSDSVINTDIEIPEWLIDEWKAIHEIEPQLFPEKYLVENIPVYCVPHSRIGDHYLDLCKLYGNNISHVFLVPWVSKGGADIETMNYIKALLNYNLATGITVISTTTIESPWADKFPDDINFVEYGKIYSHLSDDEKEILLIRLLLQMAPNVIHNINSDLGYQLFITYGNALNSISNLYVSSFCFDITQEGMHLGYPICYLPYCFDCLKAVIADNQSFLDRLLDIYAFDKNKLHLHYQPVQIIKKPEYFLKIDEKKYIDIVWAGRRDRQKRPDILLNIARACQDLPFRFHVHGEPTLDGDLYGKELTEQNNITCYGVYDGLDSLPIEEYDLFLYTSEWDGLPNVLLEAMALGLPVVAPNVGGISELIDSEKTGFLIDPYDDISQYVECLQKIYNDRSLLTYVVNNAYELVRRKHSWESFVENLKKFPGYISQG